MTTTGPGTRRSSAPEADDHAPEKVDPLTLLDERKVSTSDDDPAHVRVEGESKADRDSLIRATGLFAAALAASFAAQLVSPTAIVAMITAGAVGLLGAAGARRLTPALTGCLAWYLACASATVAVIQVAHTAQHAIALTLTMTIVAVGLPLARWFQLQASGSTPLLAIVNNAARILTLPTTGLAAVVIGGGVAMPLISTYAPIVHDPDSAWFITSTQHVQENGIGLLQETHDVFLPHLTVGPLLTIGGYQAVIAFVILNMVALAVLTAYIGYRITHDGAGALVAATVLLSIPAIIDRVDRVPMYPAAFFFAYGSAFLLHQAMANPERTRWLPVVSGLGIVLAYEAHGVGQIFLTIPFLLLLLHPWAKSRRPFFIALVTVAVASLPRLWMNVSVDGFRAMRSSYADFSITKYLPIINKEFWGYNSDTTPIGYLANVPGMAERAFGGRGTLLLLLIPLVIAAMNAGRRALVFGVVTTALFIAALTISSPSTFDRYLTPLGVGFALVVAVGAVGILRSGDQGKVIGRVVVGAILVGGLFQMIDTSSGKATDREAIVHGPSSDLAAAVDNDKAVVGVRPYQLLYTDHTIEAINGRLMAEDDWITFLTWPSDEEVAEVLERYNIGWVYIMPDYRFEVEYHQTWTERLYDLPVRHVFEVLNSDDFCLATEEFGNMVFRYGECQPGDLRTVPDEIYESFYDAKADADPEGEVPVDGSPEETETAGDVVVADGELDEAQLEESQLSDDDPRLDA